MRIGVPKEVKIHEYRVGLVPGSVRELVLHGHEVLVETQAGAGDRLPGRGLSSPPARASRPTPPTVFAERRAGREGEGTAAGRMGAAAARAGAVHLPAPRARPRADRRADGDRLHRHRLRDGDGRAGRPAAAGADERGRRAHGRAGRRALPGEGGRRRGHPALAACRGCRRGASRSSAAAWSGSNAARIAHRHAGECHGARPQSARAGRARHRVQRPGGHACSPRATRWSARCWTPTW